MATDDIKRLHYYQRQYLGALDFEDQQVYHRDMRRRLNLAHHTWGIVAGLELEVGANGVDINITPGMAIDGYGREIVMFTPTQLDPTLFRLFRGVDYHTVCLEYKEALTQSPQVGYGQCDQPNQFGRVGENFQVVVEEPSHDEIMVNGQTIVFPKNLQTSTTFFTKIIDAEDKPILPPPPLPTAGPDNQILPLDESVPYQELPVDDPTVPIIASWLIPLGRVRWDGTTGKQVFAGDKNNPITLPDGRHYIGSVASRLLTPARNLVVRDRNTDVPLPAVDPTRPDGVVMTIEGTLQVERQLIAKDDIQMDGGALDFRDAGGSSDGKGGTDPLFTITRRGTDTTSGIDLRVQIGVESKGNDHFVIGSGANDLFKIADNGNIAVTGDVSITGVLDFGSTKRQMIDLWTTNDGKKQYGIGVQTNTTYFRSHSDFCWFQDGVHSDTQSDPGGGHLQLKLDLNGDLYFGARTRQMLNLWSTNYGIGVQANTLYYRSDGDFCWFKSGTHNDAQDNAGGGKLQMKLDADGGLDVSGSHIAFHSTTDFNFTTGAGFSVTLGQRIGGKHGSDSIYGSPNLWLDADGAVIAKQGFRISPMNGAAFFPVGAAVPKNGDVVVLDIGANDGSVISSHGANDPFVVGVAMDPSTPGFILAKQPYSSQPEGMLVALIGIVQCTVDNTSSLGDIVVGDLLTTGSSAGNAQKADATTPRGGVLGKALEDVPALSQKTINVLIMPS